MPPFLDIPDYTHIRDAFCLQFRAADSGHSSSLPFIRNPLPSTSLIKPNSIFQVFVIGGTNSETATVRYNEDGTVSIIEYQAFSEFDKFRTIDDLYRFIDQYVDDIICAIGINFAFTLEPKTGPKGQLDGIMIDGETKGHAFAGLQHELVGADIEKHLKAMYGRDVIVSVGNDVVCLITSIINRQDNRSNLFAGIVGTGVNLAFFLDDQTVINTQVADFNNFTQTSTGKRADADSPNAGKQLFEKEVAAGTLFQHYNILVEQLTLLTGPLQSTKELAILADGNVAREGDIARGLFKRSASLLAAMFAGFYEHRGKPTKLTAIMQGGLFWEGPNYKEMVVDAMIELGVPADVITFEILERSGLIGAAKLITGGL